MLRNTHVPVPADDNRRIDLLVPGLNAASGLPLFCDVTVVSPITKLGGPRGGTSNQGGALLVSEAKKNDATYTPVTNSGLGVVHCLGHEVYGRWHEPCTILLVELARERSRGLPVRLRKGLCLKFLSRLSSFIAVALQRAVADAVLRDIGGDIASKLLVPIPSISAIIAL